MQFQSYKYFADMKLSIKEWLKPEDPEKFRMMISKTESQRHKTCVHVRRGDFLTDEQHAGTDSNYTISAIDHLRSLCKCFWKTFKLLIFWIQITELSS